MKQMMNAKLLFSVLVVALMMGTTGAFAQTQDVERGGTSGAAQLLVPLTARTVGLGGGPTSGLADLNGLEALYTNPAGLVANTGTSAMFSRMDYLADIGVNYFGVGQRFGNNQLAFTISAWDFGDIPKTTEEVPEVSSVTYNAQFITAGLTYARQLTDRIAAGATVKVINESIDDLSGSAVAFDAGMTYVVGETGLRLGVSLKNVGSELSYTGSGLNRQVKLPTQPANATNNTVRVEAEGVELPSLLNFGMAYTRSVGAGAVVTVLGNFRSNSFEQDQYAGGVEVGLFDMLYLRGGLELQKDADLSTFEAGSFGVGLNFQAASMNMMLDYAYRPADLLGDVQMFTLSVML